MSGTRTNNLENVINLMARLPRAMRKSMDHDILKPLLQEMGIKMSPHHMIIMKMVTEEKLLSISEIGKEAMISGAQMTKSVDKLTSLGLLKRVPDPDDRRKTGIAVTENGQDLVAVFDKTVNKHLKTRLSWLTDEELAHMLDALHFLIKIIEKF